MPQERFHKQALFAKVKRKRPVGRPQTRWADYIEDLGWNRLGQCWKWWQTMMCGGSILNCCCPCNPHGHEQVLKEEEEK